jgi:hypothetical protein
MKSDNVHMQQTVTELEDEYASTTDVIVGLELDTAAVLDTQREHSREYFYHSLVDNVRKVGSHQIWRIECVPTFLTDVVNST